MPMRIVNADFYHAMPVILLCRLSSHSAAFVLLFKIIIFIAVIPVTSMLCMPQVRE